MSIIYQQDWEAFAVGTDIDPNVPNWLLVGGGVSPTLKVQSGFDGKYADQQSVSGEFSGAIYNVSFAQTYQELRTRLGSSGDYVITYLHATADQFPDGYYFYVVSGGWGLGYSFINGAGINVATGTMPTYDPTDFRQTLILDNNVLTAYINGVAVAGASYDFTNVGNPFPSGRFSFLDYSGDNTIGDIVLLDAPIVAVPSGSVNISASVSLGSE